MHEVIPLGRARSQFVLQVATVLACAIAAAPFTDGRIAGPVAAILLMVDLAWLGLSMRHGASCYRSHLQRLTPDPAVLAQQVT